ncbi:hypothetical protein DL96DRAFT_835737 [Flagelloscypha sp. PMI_526]|nr:hypothetical protein DL96DRAFT_835737 [Flagelloscypha sp. PMI_526]
MFDGDEGSLFGDSPPASPSVFGLALPGAPDATVVLPVAAHQDNVGTIALAGSSTSSELSTPIVHHDPQSVITQLDPLLRRPKGARKRRPASPQRTSGAPRDRIPPPPIDMPDFASPAPSHFFRNHPALLGHAGMVSGVDPARIRHGRPTGASAAEPIVVEDEPRYFSPPRPRGPAWTLPSNVTPEEVVRTLDKQSIVPLLQNMFQFFVSRKSFDKEQPPPFFRRGGSSSEPPTKRRKLTKVPAGAADWDVPFPFEEGDGPKGYREEWEKDRARKLVSQIVDIFKEAAATVSVKKAQVEQAKQAELAALFSASLHTPSQPSLQASPSPASTPMPQPSEIDQLLQLLLGHGLNDMSNGQSPSSDNSVDQWMETFNDMVPGMDGASGFEHLSFDEMLNQFTGGPIDSQPELRPAIGAAPNAFDETLLASMASTSQIPDSNIDPLLLSLGPRQGTPSLSLGASTPSTTPGPETPLLGYAPFNFNAPASGLSLPLSASSDLAGTLRRQVLRQQMFIQTPSDQEWLNKLANVSAMDKGKELQKASGGAEERKEIVRKAKERRDAVRKEMEKNDDERRRLTIEHAVLSRMAMHYGADSVIS